jgi:hypothetical protein
MWERMHIRILRLRTGHRCRRWCAFRGECSAARGGITLALRIVSQLGGVGVRGVWRTCLESLKKPHFSDSGM